MKKNILSEMDKHKSEFRLSDAADFSWDQAYIFRPYTTEEEMEQQLGMPFEPDNNLEERDDLNVIVFVKEDRVAGYAEIPRSYGDFLVQEEPLTPKKDRIQFEEIKT
ncbi:hypothetical protein J9317_08375 [Metabacillus sp. KIGAM252]|uniref:Uncharacterized protein n=1 Tax=Metabacillus flavus TaxID=2823519 RepID=A0ABS5LDF7_9BACI|nr:hypothetical protein [Metabacillus flavus]MBS2968770.1 hypothetical protein [Metabacillus flavus]